MCVSGAPANKRIVVFVDDLNMPKLDSYGSQPPIELLRQFQDFQGFYDRDKFFWKEIQVDTDYDYLINCVFTRMCNQNDCTERLKYGPRCISRMYHLKG